MHQRLQGQLQNDRYFECFGLLEEEFSSIAARTGMQGLLYILWKPEDKGRDIHRRRRCILVGFIMARLLLHSGKRSSVVCDRDFVKNATPIEEANVSMDAAGITWMESRRAMYIDIPASENCGRETKIGLCFWF